MEQVNTVDDFLKKLERYNNYSNVFYRGQLEEYKNITSAISRDQGYTKNENSIYNEAIAMRSVEFEGLKLPMERLSKMQHYGIPSRLVDLTVNPLIALFFAVKKVDAKSNGVVYVFIQPEFSFDHKRVKLLALLATLETLEINAIKYSYQNYYSESITDAEILEFASNGAFIKRSKELEKSNKRLFCQEGTFAICGNEVKNNEIVKSILPLDSIPPIMAIRIPFEHKQAVKKELDRKHGINEAKIFPELPSVADYLKEKYKNVHFDPNGSYNILEVKDVSYAGARRCSIVAALNKDFDLLIDEVKLIGTRIIEQYKETNDVVWIFIAKNGDDYIMRNWILRCQWTSETLDSIFKPSPIGKAEESGYSWCFEKSYSTLADYYDEHAFADDKILYAQNMKTFEELEPLYENLVSAIKIGEMKDLEAYVSNNESLITKLSRKFGEFGFSRNIEYNQYLNNFQEIAMHLENVILWLKNEKLNSVAKKYQISNCFKDAKLHFEAIKAQAAYWKNIINLSDKEYSEIDPEKNEKKEFHYTQTIPINPNGLDVAFSLDILKNDDNTVSIKGKTSLYDKASLMISIRDLNGLTLAQNKSFVEKGCFDFGRLGKEGVGFSKGKYRVNISLAIPSVQNKEFVLKAGIEYENLNGKYVDRTGAGPSVSYTEEFEV